MTNQQVKRKLIAILSAGVKGYSRLMGEDEKGTATVNHDYFSIESYFFLLLRTLLNTS
jgi:hypothetical protein